MIFAVPELSVLQDPQDILVHSYTRCSLGSTLLPAEALEPPGEEVSGILNLAAGLLVNERSSLYKRKDCSSPVGL